jgi:hypothetical protein
VSVILSEATDLLLPLACNATASSITGSVALSVGRGFSPDINPGAKRLPLAVNGPRFFRSLTLGPAAMTQKDESL